MRRTQKTSRPANRRIRGNSPRNHLLDVKIRTSTARRQRREKVARWVLKLVLLAMLIAGSVYGLRAALDKFFFSNPEYTLQRITMDLDGIFTREEALSETGLHEGVNIFSVDLGAIEKALGAAPQVASVRVERQLPGELRIQLVSRRPVAWIAAEDQAAADPRSSEKALLVDESGFLMRPRHMRPEYLHLPIIYGASSDNIQAGEPLHSEDLRLALTLLKTVSTTPSSPLNIRSLDISRGYCITVVNDQNARIIFSIEDFAGQLARIDKLLAHCQETGRAIDTVNLMVKRNTPVTFIAAAAPALEETPTLPAPAKGGKLRRN